MFEAVILAGGFGTRLKSISGEIPKPMVEVAGLPFIYRLMALLDNSGCSKIVVSLGYRAEYIKRRIEADKPVKCSLEFSVEDEPLGTGGAIKKAAKCIKGDKFLVLNGDSFSDINYAEFFAAAQNVDLLISGVQVDDTARYGTLELGLGGAVLSLNEKGRTGPGVINSGIYVVKTKDLLAFKLDCFSFERDFIPLFNGTFSAHVSAGYFVDIGVPDDYYKACGYFK